jgi:cobyrinic acid a,c-diamide synthase
VERLADWIEDGVDMDTLLLALPEMSTNLDNGGGAGDCGTKADRPSVVSTNLDDSVGIGFGSIPSVKIPAECDAGDTGDRTDTGAARVRIAVARDAAFAFYYQENFRLLEAAGAELAFFSPLRDEALPSDVGGVYLGGGYPELHADTLANNVRLREEIRKRSLRGLPVFAECGGYMYLMRSLTDGDGRRMLMAGVFPWNAHMDTRRRGLGYREITTTADTLLGPAGTVLRGHEFHYSYVSEQPDEAALLDAGVEAVYAVTDRTGEPVAVTGYRAGGVLASYVHLHFGSNPLAAQAFVQSCHTHRNQEHD